MEIKIAAVGLGHPFGRISREVGLHALHRGLCSCLCKCHPPHYEALPVYLATSMDRHTASMVRGVGVATRTVKG